MMGNLSASPIGARYVVQLEIFGFFGEQTPNIFSLSQRRQIFFDSFSVDLEIELITIVFNQASSLLNGETVVCFSGLPPDSRRRKRIPTGETRVCGNTFNIIISSKCTA